MYVRDKTPNGESFRDLLAATRKERENGREMLRYDLENS